MELLLWFPDQHKHRQNNPYIFFSIIISQNPQKYLNPTFIQNNNLYQILFKSPNPFIFFHLPHDLISIIDMILLKVFTIQQNQWILPKNHYTIMKVRIFQRKINPILNNQ